MGTGADDPALHGAVTLEPRQRTGDVQETHRWVGGAAVPDQVAAVGVHDLVIVDTPDALLIMPRERAQDVRAVVAELKARKGSTHL